MSDSRVSGLWAFRMWPEGVEVRQQALCLGLLYYTILHCTFGGGCYGWGAVLGNMRSKALPLFISVAHAVCFILLCHVYA